MKKNEKSKAFKVIENQLDFFEKNAEIERLEITAPIFRDYADKENREGLRWLRDRAYILDYGCGTGTSIDSFLSINGDGGNQFVGVDISEVAIERARQKYKKYQFHVIENNDIPQIENDSVDGAYLLHVLHHSHDHEKIFLEIFQKLRIGGKFFVADLSSNNIFIKIFRGLFIYSPKFIRCKFSDDLVTDDGIPEKYKVDPDRVQELLQKIGFTVQEVGCGHLFFFLFIWVDRFVPLSSFSFVNRIYKRIEQVEKKLLDISFFRKRSEVFYFKCVKEFSHGRD